MDTATAVSAPEAPQRRGVPRLESGDRLTRIEFERRYEAMPDNRKAELIEGVVYLTSPVRVSQHARPASHLITWLGVYQANTPGKEVGRHGAIRLDMDNEPQPDGFLRILPEFGGQPRTSADDYVEGAPELVAEVATSSVSIDLHDKMNAYRRNGVREYLVWRVLDGKFDWFLCREGQYERLTPGPGAIYRSEVFPGLWLDPLPLLRGELAAALGVLQQGLASPEHAESVARLRERR